MIEQLESRLLFYVYPNGVEVVFEENTKTYHVWGTAGNDQLYFHREFDTEYNWIQMWSGYNGPANQGYPFASINITSSGQTVNVHVHGGNGHDTLVVGDDVYGLRFTLDGGNGADTLVGGAHNADTFIGGDNGWNDTVSYAGRQDKLGVLLDGNANDGATNEGDNVTNDIEIVVGGENADILYGNGGPNRLDGGGGRDSIWGVGGNDTLVGGAGNDEIDGGLGADLIDGGLGDGDKAAYKYRNNDVFLSPDGVAADGEQGEGDNIRSTVEVLIGGNGNDIIDLWPNDGPAVDRVGIGREGNDSFHGSPGRDVFDGGAGDDGFYNSPGNDYYMGGDGRDSISYQSSTSGVNVSLDEGDNDGVVGERDNVRSDIETVGGTQYNDLIQAAAHPASAAIDNTFYGHGGNDTLRGFKGNDSLYGSEGNDQVDGGDGNDRLDAWSGNDSLYGGKGHDSLFGGLDNDQLVAGDGNDLLDGGWGADLITGGTGTDTASYVERASAVNVIIDMNPDDGAAGENDNVMWDMENVTGGAGNDTIHGSNSMNVLRGGGGNDQIFGEGGMDSLDGGAGADTLDGGAGADTADYSARTKKLWISVNGVANDGELNENDNVLTNVEIVRGGSADDVITDDPASTTSNEFWGGGGYDLLKGWGGDDTLHGDGHVDTLEGGDGMDILDGGGAGDYLDGGAGDRDHAWYGNRMNMVVVTLDVTKNDGEAGENDFVMGSIECITGGSGNDSLTGDAKANAIYGQGGLDTITGGAGVDTLLGGSGNDLIDSRDGGVDHVVGGTDTDKARIDYNLDDLTSVETLLA